MPTSLTPGNGQPGRGNSVPKPPPGLTLANWDLGGEVTSWAYLNVDKLFATVDIPGAAVPTNLPVAHDPDFGELQLDPPEGRVSLDDYALQAPVDGIIIVRSGKIIFEKYPE